MLLQRGDAVQAGLRLFETQFLRGLLHPGFILPDDLVHPALEQAGDLPDPAAVLFGAHGADAAAPAPPQVEFQAGAELPAQHRLARDPELAGAERIGMVEEVQQVFRVGDGTVRTEIGAGPAVDAPRQVYPREFLRRDDDPGIGLGVLQEDVVAGLVLLDQVVFQQQRVGLRIHDAELGVGDLGHQHAGLERQPLRRHEILRHPLVEVLGLPHINHLPGGVVVAIHPRGMWKQGDFLPDSQ